MKFAVQDNNNLLSNTDQMLRALNTIGLLETDVRNLLVEKLSIHRLDQCRNPFAAKYARKHLSQTDEDGITVEIIRRIGLIGDGTFCEFGVGNGLENNTLILLSLGWKGSWFGAERLKINTANSKKLHFNNVWIVLENIVKLHNHSLEKHNKSEHDVVSMDVDGNDYIFIKELLESGVKPKLFIAEYNGVFPPDVIWSMKYNPKHLDRPGDRCESYYGASLGAINKLFSIHGYFLCACNPQTGVNAFFVKNEFRDLFPEVPDCIDDIYVPPFYRVDNTFSHKVTAKFVESFL